MDINLLSNGSLLRPTDKEKVGLYQPSDAREQGAGIVAHMTINDDKPWLSEPNLKDVETMEDYLSIKKTEATISLKLAKDDYLRFREELAKTHPDLASKSFGFTVDAAGNFTILTPQNNLSQSEKSWLTEQLSQYRGLKVNLMAHVEASSLLAKHDKTGLLSRYQLDSDDIAHMIDYGAILRSDDIFRSLTEQIQERAPRKIPSISEKV